MEPVLSQGVGYAIIVAFGVFFVVVMNYITYLQNKYSSYKSTDPTEFTTSSRNVKLGLIVSGIISSWVDASTILQSATQSYDVGVGGGWFYGVGGILQISVFSLVAAKIKANANTITTFPEMALVRFGKVGHLAFLWIGLVCNTIVSSSMLSAAASAFQGMTGMNYYVVLFFIPFLNSLYVFTGGLRATFISDAIHSLILIVFMLAFLFAIFTGSNAIGSPSKLAKLLAERSLTIPCDTSYHGSYLTFRSSAVAIYGIRSVITGFGLINCDQAYWSRAIAANPESTSKAYYLGGVAYFAIPLAMGTGLGLGARGLTVLKDFPELTDANVSSGLAPLAAMYYLLGESGVVLLLIVVFLAVTSSLAGEMTATSTLFSFDIYKCYINKNATPKQVLRAAEIGVFIWAIYIFGINCLWYGVGIDMGWLYNFMGVATASGVFPVALAFTWKDLNTAGAVIGAVGGSLGSLIIWLVTCYYRFGHITTSNLSDGWISFAGTISAIGLGGVLSVGISLLKPQNFDWNITRDSSKSNADPLRIQKDEKFLQGNLSVENGKDNAIVVSESQSSDSEEQTIDPKKLQKDYQKYMILYLIAGAVTGLIIPTALGAPPYVFSEKFFTFFVAVTFIWLFVALYVIVFAPLLEYRSALFKLWKKAYNK